MIINFVANFQTGYVGEIGDANHLCRELMFLGHQVNIVPQDIWREWVRGERNENWEAKLPIKADINIICKWHHFNGEDIKKLREVSGAPVFYWVWDYMQNEDWHLSMVRESDLYLGNDVFSGKYPDELRDKLYYFPFDVADMEIQPCQAPVPQKRFDVSFFGSWIGQGDRQKWLIEINKTNPITVFSWNRQDWPKEFEVYDAVYGEEFVQRVRESKIVLGFSVEPNCWGYWSNRTGKTLLAGGFLLYQYAPGMELFLKDGAEYFSSIEEAREKIDHYLIDETGRDKIAAKGFKLGRESFSSRQRVKELIILIERFLKNAS